jgi:hypothetical protein
MDREEFLKRTRTASEKKRAFITQYLRDKQPRPNWSRGTSNPKPTTREPASFNSFNGKQAKPGHKKVLSQRPTNVAPDPLPENPFLLMQKARATITGAPFTIGEEAKLEEKASPQKSASKSPKRTIQSREYAYYIDRQQHESLKKWLQPTEYPLESGRKIIQKVNDYCTDTFNKSGISSYSFQKRLGQGAYGQVKLAIHNSTNCRVAVKIYEKFKLVDA